MADGFSNAAKPYPMSLEAWLDQQASQQAAEAHIDKTSTQTGGWFWDAQDSFAGAIGKAYSKAKNARIPRRVINAPINAAKLYNHIDSEFLRGAASGFVSAQSLVAPAFYAVAREGIRARDRAQSVAARASSRQDRFFSVDPHFTPFRVLSGTEQIMLDERKLNALQTYHQKKQAADQHEMQRIIAVANHRQSQVGKRSLSKYGNARAFVLYGIEQQRNTVEQQFQAAQTAFDHAITTADHIKKHSWIWNRSARRQASRIRNQAHRDRRTARRTNKREISRLRSAGSRGHFFGLIFNNLKTTALQVQNQNWIAYQIAEAQHDYQNKQSKAQIRGARQIAKQEKRNVYSQVRQERQASRSALRKNVKNTAKNAVNNVGNKTVELGHRAKGNIALGAYWTAAAAAAAGTSVAGGGARAGYQGAKRGYQAYQNVRQAAKPAPGSST